MKIRKMRKTEKQVFLKMEKKELYPWLSIRALEDRLWEKALPYILEVDGSIIGGVVWEEYDVFPNGKSIIDLAAIFILNSFRGQGYGKKLFEKSLALAKESLNAIAIHIETVGQEAFYRKVLPSDYVEMTINVGGTMVTFFAANITGL